MEPQRRPGRDLSPLFTLAILLTTDGGGPTTHPLPSCACACRGPFVGMHCYHQPCCHLHTILPPVPAVGCTQNYIFLTRIGDGAYGSVWKCIHKQTGLIVAVKKLKDVPADAEVGARAPTALTQALTQALTHLTQAPTQAPAHMPLRRPLTAGPYASPTTLTQTLQPLHRPSYSRLI